jgi:hypothetical protein
MVWSALHLYLQPADGVIPRLLACPELARELYYLADLRGHRWPSGRRHRHGLPPGGLVVVRGTGRQAAAESQSDVEFQSLPSDAPGVDVPLVDLVWGGARPSALNPYLADHVRRLRYLKWIGRATGAVTAEYWASSWDGGLDWQEGGWVLGPEDHRYERDRSGTVLERRVDGTRAIAERSVIELVLAGFRLALPTPYCGWLTRGFEWSRYRVPSQVTIG